MHSLELVYSKNYFNLAKIFVLRLFKMLANQTDYSGLNNGLSLNFCLMKSANRMFGLV